MPHQPGTGAQSSSIRLCRVHTEGARRKVRLRPLRVVVSVVGKFKIPDHQRTDLSYWGPIWTDRVLHAASQHIRPMKCNRHQRVSYKQARPTNSFVPSASLFLGVCDLCVSHGCHRVTSGRTSLVTTWAMASRDGQRRMTRSSPLPSSSNEATVGRVHGRGWGLVGASTRAGPLSQHLSLSLCGTAPGSQGKSHHTAHAPTKNPPPRMSVARLHLPPS